MGWVDVVNETLGWEDAAGREALRREFAPADIDFEWLAASVAALRGAVAASLLGFEVAVPVAASQWLATVTLQATTRGGSGTPALRALRRDSPLPPALETRLSTALVQWAATETMTATRCAGLVAGGPRIWDAALDAHFANRAGFGLYGGRGGARDLCPRLVDGPRAGRFCSKACSNVAFAARKAERDPDYFARKQARYRDGKRRAAARVERAFAFVD